MGLLNRFVAGVRALVRQTRDEEDFEVELQGFLDTAVEQKLRAGLSRDAAIASARRELGNVAAVKERVRDVGWELFVTDCYRDLRFGIRMLRKAPGFAFVAILSLALGIGATTAIFSILNSLLLKPLPVNDPNQLVIIGSDKDEAVNLSYRVWKQIRDHRLLPQPIAWAPDRLTLTETTELKYVEAVWATGDVFAVLGVPAILGRTFDSRDDRSGGGPDGPVVVISHAFWQQQFGGAVDVVGRRLSIERVPFTIIGVTPQGFFGLNVGASFDIMLPLETEPMLGRVPKRLESPNWPWLSVMGRLDDGQTPASVGGRVQAAQAQIREATMPPYDHAEDRARYLHDTWVVRAAPAGVSRLRRQYDTALFTLLAVVTLVLLVACASIAMLMLARSNARRQEFTVRCALGAARGRLLQQLLIESLLLAAIGASLGVLLAQWGGRALVSQLSTWATTAFLDLSIDWRVLAVTLVTTVLTAVLFGVLPAYRSASVSAAEVLLGRRRTLTDEGRGIGGLVVLQIALSLVLMFGAGLFLRSFTTLVYRDLGFDRNRLLVSVVDARRTGVPASDRPELYERLRTAVAALPGVESAATSLATPLGSAGMRFTPDITLPDDTTFAGQTFRILSTPVSPGWFHTFGTRLLAGRDFNSNDRRGAMNVAAVNEAFIRRYFDGRTPLGQTLLMGLNQSERVPLEIVGLVQDAAFTNVREAVEPMIYRPLAQQLNEGLLASMPSISISVRAVGGMTPRRLSDPVARAVAAVDPALTVFNQTVTLQLRHLYMRERLLASVAGIFGLLGLLLAAVGLYGVTAYAVRLRRREIGIRMALGANRHAVVRMVLGRVAWRMAAGIAAGTIVSFWAAQYAQTLLFGVESRDELTFVAAAGLLAVVAIVAGWLPARHAARVDPASVLREG